MQNSSSMVLTALVLGACGGDSESNVVTEVGDASDTRIEEIDFETDGRQEISLPPDFGDECDGNEDCVTGYCIEGVSGFVCTKTCVEECPAGWGCKGVQSGSSDVVFVCVPDGAPENDVIIVDSDVDDSSPVDTSDTNIPVDTQVDTDTGPTLGNACEAAPGVGDDNLKAESTVSAGDWPDCIVGCNFEANPTIWVVDLKTSSFSGVIGQFDADEHLYDFDDGEGSGPDIDVIAVKAPARTMMEFAVLKDAVSSATEPLIYVSDGFAVRTFNSDVNAGNSCGRTTMAFPFVSDLPLYVVTEDAVNYDLWGPTGYSPGTVGGADYGWILRIRTSAFSPSEMGTLAVGGSRALTNEVLSVGGEMRYYRFYAPGESKPTVTLSKRSGNGFAPSVAGMKTIAGELVWQRVEEDGNDDGTVMLGSNGFRPCIPTAECPAGFSCPPNMCDGGDAEFVFAVFDFNGAAGPGAFSYDVTVRIE